MVIHYETPGKSLCLVTVSENTGYLVSAAGFSCLKTGADKIPPTVFKNTIGRRWRRTIDPSSCHTLRLGGETPPEDRLRLKRARQATGSGGQCGG